MLNDGFPYHQMSESSSLAIVTYSLFPPINMKIQCFASTLMKVFYFRPMECFQLGVNGYYKLTL